MVLSNEPHPIEILGGELQFLDLAKAVTCPFRHKVMHLSADADDPKLPCFADIVFLLLARNGLSSAFCDGRGAERGSGPILGYPAIYGDKITPSVDCANVEFGPEPPPSVGFSAARTSNVTVISQSPWMPNLVKTPVPRPPTLAGIAILSLARTRFHLRRAPMPVGPDHGVRGGRSARSGSRSDTPA